LLLLLRPNPEIPGRGEGVGGGLIGGSGGEEAATAADDGASAAGNGATSGDGCAGHAAAAASSAPYMHLHPEGGSYQVSVPRECSMCPYPREGSSGMTRGGHFLGCDCSCMPG
ncbi:hypothetical protein CLOM_g15310, partial [Closterium sp. NIES-68]